MSTYAVAVTDVVAGGGRLLSVSGPLDVDTPRELCTRAHQQLARDHRLLVIDISRVRGTPRGWAGLLAALDVPALQAARDEVPLRVVVDPQAVELWAGLAGIGHAVYSSPAAALEPSGSPP